MERLQKVMAKAGIASRRRCEELIADGKVSVNGKVVTEFGRKVDLNKDNIFVSGNKLSRPRENHYLVLYKPRGYVSTVKDEKGRKIVLDLLKGFSGRVYPVGRLDYASEGLLLLTNDGDLTYALTHPKNHVSKVYLVIVSGMPSDSKLFRLRQGILLKDGITAPAQVKPVEITRSKSLLEFTLYEGRNRQIRRMCESIGHPVLRLLRIKVANIYLDGLSPGQYRRLTEKELRELKDIAGIEQCKSC